MSNSKLPQSLAGFAIGVGVGVALGILLAPKSGEETREYLSEGARGVLDDAVRSGRKLTKQAKQSMNEVADRAKQGYNEIGERIMNAADAGEQAFRKSSGT